MIEYTVKVSETETKWYKNGKLHREDGPAIEYNGTKEWYKNGKLHREDGPAIEWTDGSESWYLNCKYHREDGPALIYRSGKKLWFLNGKEYTEEEYQKVLNPVKELTVKEVSELLGYNVKIVKG
jgi:hypothetical protein